MDHAFPDGAVVVGVDGTGKARHALAWAGEEAARRALPIHVLYAFSPRISARSYELLPTAELIAAGERITATAAAELRAAHPEVDVTAEVQLDEPAVALVDASERASMSVLGARGLGTVLGRLLGSVSQKVAAHAAGPVVVVREGATRSGGPVVVGVDPEHDAPEPLEFAFTHAAAHGVGVRIVHAAHRERPRADLADGRVHDLLAEAERHGLEAARELGARWAQRHPEVPVETRTVVGRPVDELVREAADASLLVVGARGHHGLAGVRLGSVARGVLHEAPLVAVVRRRDGNRETMTG
ncbi:universal stress protein [Georgenia yuyongxinii]|uniref:Universal stress protein n=1 Tax=Georgenia yuyongxinii TaxID=2589797 RepID=A0A552WLQ2_9MICO|nr:universal stress protein [Georgenia yuyongxinii]TRW43676.1 universal stress protein [Georgenia yuyongxinii]